MKNNILLLILILLLVVNAVFWGSQKEGFHVDEMFSYEQVGNTEYPKPEYDRPNEPCMNTWHSRDYYEDYLVIDSQEAFDISAFYQSASKNGAHPPLYLTVLGMFISVVSQNRFTKWSGIGLNIIFYIFTLIVIYDLAKRIFRKEKLAFFAVFLSGISVGIVSTIVFVRVYMILTFFTISFVGVHARMLERKQRMISSIAVRISLYVNVAIIFIAGSLSQYYFLVFAFLFCLAYWFFLLVSRETRMLLEYTLVMVGSLCIYIYLWPTVVRDLLSGDRGIEAFRNFKGAESRYATEAIHYLQEVDLQITAGFFSAFLISVLIIITAITIRKKVKSIQFDGADGVCVEYSFAHKKVNMNETEQKLIPLKWIIILLILFSVICYVLLIAKVAPTLMGEPYKTTRYIVCVYPLAVILQMFFVTEVFLRWFKGKVYGKIVWPVLIMMVLAGYFVSGVKYLYPETLEQQKFLSSYSTNRAIYITEWNYEGSNLNVYFTYHEAVYQTNASGIVNISEAFADLDEKEIIIYISEFSEDPQKVLQGIYNELHPGKCQYLFTTTGSNRAYVYLMELG